MAPAMAAPGPVAPKSSELMPVNCSNKMCRRQMQSHIPRDAIEHTNEKGDPWKKYASLEQCSSNKSVEGANADNWKPMQ
jgi:hypothetical protein